ncbi:ENTH/VHS family protein [Trifolium repens]|nr:ENTH/VHS family protein [Trifolium repens]KAK2402061.1 ENTH/VHS family protein [Trifolium repens]
MNCYYGYPQMNTMLSYEECRMLAMNVLWTRLSETRKDWRYVYKVHGSCPCPCCPNLTPRPICTICAYAVPDQFFHSHILAQFPG